MNGAPRRYLEKPDDMVTGSLKRLSGNADFTRIFHWLGQSLAGLDELNRHVSDAVVMRQNQGAAAVLGEFLDEAVGKSASGAQALNTSARGSAT